MLLTAEQSFVLAGLEALLGGSPDRTPRERRLSEIDWSLTRRLFESIVYQLSGVWQELGGVTLSAGEIDPHDASQVASVSEPTFTLLLECRIAKQSFALAMLIPWAAIEPVEDAISGRDTSHAQEVQTASPMQRAMSDVPVTLRAEVAALDLEVSEILSLVPGSVVKFGVPADDGVMLYAENVKLARAQPGSHGPRRAVQICGPEGAG
jgi:flagellar motor switch protein FliM